MVAAVQAALPVERMPVAEQPSFVGVVSGRVSDHDEQPVAEDPFHLQGTSD